MNTTNESTDQKRYDIEKIGISENVRLSVRVRNVGIYPLVVTVAMSGGLTGISVILIVAVVLVLSIIFTRISFAFPALAIQQESGVAQAWRETRGRGLRLYAIYASQVIPFLLVGFGIAFVVKLIVPGESATVDLILSFVMYVLRYIGLAVLVAMISLSYRAVVQPATLASTEDTAAVFD